MLSALSSMLTPLIGLLPVLLFLLALVYFDSYKLMKLRTVLGVLAAGAAMAFVSFFVNGWLIDALDLEFEAYSHGIAPAVEESLKALVMLYLFKTHRIGFLVDAAILGFGTGAGFAVVENFYYLFVNPDAALGLWIVRGFGTALMHGAVAAIFSVLLLAISETRARANFLSFLPCLLAATAIHAAFNHFFLSPVVSTMATVLIMPIVLYEIFQLSERRLGKWLGTGFDADARMLELLNSGQFADSAMGKYLHTLKDRFNGPVVADILCYTRLYTELALRAKGLLLMRESGFDVPVDDLTRAKFVEMQYLESSIGKTGLLAIQPMLHLSRKKLWQLYILDDGFQAN